MALILVLGAVNYAGVKFGGDGAGGGHGPETGADRRDYRDRASGRGGQRSESGLVDSAPPGGAAGFFTALVAALWAYDGWNNVSMVSSEIRQPQRNLPRALIAGTAAVIAIYLLTNLAYFRVLPAREVAGAPRVAATDDAACFRGRRGQRGQRGRDGVDIRGAERVRPLGRPRALRHGARRAVFPEGGCRFTRFTAPRGCRFWRYAAGPRCWY